MRADEFRDFMQECGFVNTMNRGSPEATMVHCYEHSQAPGFQYQYFDHHPRTTIPNSWRLVKISYNTVSSGSAVPKDGDVITIQSSMSKVDWA